MPKPPNLPRFSDLLQAIKASKTQTEIVKNKSIILVLGPTGAGKSTLIAAASGCPLEETEDGYWQIQASANVNGPIIGQRAVSETSGVHFFLLADPDDSERMIGDTGGFFDTRGSAKSLENAMGIYTSIQSATASGIILVATLDDIQNDRARGLSKTLSVAFEKLLLGVRPKDIWAHVRLVVTKATATNRKRKVVNVDRDEVIRIVQRVAQEKIDGERHNPDRAQKWRFLARDNGQYISVYHPDEGRSKDDLVQALSTLSLIPRAHYIGLRTPAQSEDILALIRVFKSANATENLPKLEEVINRLESLKRKQVGLKREITKTQDQRNRLRQQVNQAYSKLPNRSLTGLAATIDDIKSQINTYKESAETMTNTVAAMGVHEIGTLAISTLTYSKQIEELEARLQEIETQKSLITTNTAGLEAKEKQWNFLQGSLASVETEITKFEKVLQTLEKWVQTYIQPFYALVKQIPGLSTILINAKELRDVVDACDRLGISQSFAAFETQEWPVNDWLRELSSKIAPYSSNVEWLIPGLTILTQTPQGLLESLLTCWVQLSQNRLDFFSDPLADDSAQDLFNQLLKHLPDSPHPNTPNFWLFWGSQLAEHFKREIPSIVVIDQHSATINTVYNGQFSTQKSWLLLLDNSQFRAIVPAQKWIGDVDGCDHYLSALFEETDWIKQGCCDWTSWAEQWMEDHANKEGSSVSYTRSALKQIGDIGTFHNLLDFVSVRIERPLFVRELARIEPKIGPEKRDQYLRSFKGIARKQLIQQVAKHVATKQIQAIEKRQQQNTLNAQLEEENRQTRQELTRVLATIKSLQMEANPSTDTESAADRFLERLNWHAIRYPGYIDSQSISSVEIVIQQLVPEAHLDYSVMIETAKADPDHYLELAKNQLKLIMTQPVVSKVQQDSETCMIGYASCIRLSQVVCQLSEEMTAYRLIRNQKANEGILFTPTLVIHGNWVVIDADIEWSGASIEIIAEKVIVLKPETRTTPIQISTSGQPFDRPAENHFPARSPGQVDGRSGRNGRAGESAGHIVIRAAHLENLSQAQLNMNGADGENGTDGENGLAGNRGFDGEKPVLEEELAKVDIFESAAQLVSPRWAFIARGRTTFDPGGHGGNGGDAGRGGGGGQAGEFHWLSEGNLKLKHDGKSGELGPNGNPGKPGSNGLPGNPSIQVGKHHRKGVPIFVPAEDKYFEGRVLKKIGFSGWETVKKFPDPPSAVTQQTQTSETIQAVSQQGTLSATQTTSTSLPIPSWGSQLTHHQHASESMVQLTQRQGNLKRKLSRSIERQESIVQEIEKLNKDISELQREGLELERLNNEWVESVLSITSQQVSVARPLPKIQPISATFSNDSSIRKKAGNLMQNLQTVGGAAGSFFKKAAKYLKSPLTAFPNYDELNKLKSDQLSQESSASYTFLLTEIVEDIGRQEMNSLLGMLGKRIARMLNLDDPDSHHRPLLTAMTHFRIDLALCDLEFDEKKETKETVLKFAIAFRFRLPGQSLIESVSGIRARIVNQKNPTPFHAYLAKAVVSGIEGSHFQLFNQKGWAFSELPLDIQNKIRRYFYLATGFNPELKSVLGICDQIEVYIRKISKGMKPGSKPQSPPSLYPSNSSLSKMFMTWIPRDDLLGDSLLSILSRQSFSANELDDLFTVIRTQLAASANSAPFIQNLFSIRDCLIKLSKNTVLKFDDETEKKLTPSHPLFKQLDRWIPELSILALSEVVQSLEKQFWWSDKGEDICDKFYSALCQFGPDDFLSYLSPKVCKQINSTPIEDRLNAFINVGSENYRKIELSNAGITRLDALIEAYPMSLKQLEKLDRLCSQ